MMINKVLERLINLGNSSQRNVRIFIPKKSIVKERRMMADESEM